MISVGAGEGRGYGPTQPCASFGTTEYFGEIVRFDEGHTFLF